MRLNHGRRRPGREDEPIKSELFRRQRKRNPDTSYVFSGEAIFEREPEISLCEGTAVTKSRLAQASSSIPCGSLKYAFSLFIHSRM